MAEADEIMWRVLDAKGELRSTLSKDGTVKGKGGETLGYINLETNEVGSPDEEFLGDGVVEEGHSGTGLTQEQINMQLKLVCRNAEEEEVGMMQELDPGFATVKSDTGRCLCIINDTGAITSTWQTSLGQIEGFEFENRYWWALIVLFLDPECVKEVAEDASE